ncbi:hypothetical protein AB6A40_006580 [Gnathostoma spinigerum]|uniref:Uncharacterized protein n=1 Tax=Gnathostoma spinigerum TaxID=75299 RepID=A0ABD6ER06_9BILA
MKGTFYHFRKKMSLYIGPIIVATIILIDWNHTRQWKNKGRPSPLDFIRDKDFATVDHSSK